MCMLASYNACLSLMATDRILWRPPGWGPFAALSSIVCPFRVRRPGVSHRARGANAPRHANSVSSSNSCGFNWRSASCRARVTRSSCSNRALRSTPRANACSRPTMSWLSAGASLPEATNLTMSLDQLYRQYSVSRTPSFNAASAAATGSSSPRASRSISASNSWRPFHAPASASTSARSGAPSASLSKSDACSGAGSCGPSQASAGSVEGTGKCIRRQRLITVTGSREGWAVTRTINECGGGSSSVLSKLMAALIFNLSAGRIVAIIFAQNCGSRACGRRPLRRRADSCSHCSFCLGSNLPDIAAILSLYLTQLRLHLVEGARGVDQPKSRGLALGPPQICRPHALEKRELLALETIALAAASADAGATQLRRRVQQHGEAGTKLALHPGLVRRDTVRGDTAAAALIGISRVGEAVAHHPLTLGQCGANDLSEVLRARGEHEQQLRVHTHALGTAIQQDGADAFAEA